MVYVEQPLYLISVTGSSQIEWEVRAQCPVWAIRLCKEWITLIRSWERIRIGFKILTNCGKVWHHTWNPLLSTFYKNLKLQGHVILHVPESENTTSGRQRNPNPHWDTSDRWGQNCQTRATTPTWSVYYSPHHLFPVFAKETKEVNHILKNCVCVSEDSCVLLQFRPYFYSVCHHFSC